MIHAVQGLASNEVFFPSPMAQPAPPLAVRIRFDQSPLSFTPALAIQTVGGRDVRLFPAATLDLITLDSVLIPVQWGEVLSETPGKPHPSYWSLIPQFGRIWREPDDRDGWSRASFALMLVNDLENHAHQGLARLRYRGIEIRDFQFQFVQQTAPYLLKQHFIAWGRTPVESSALSSEVLEPARSRARRALSTRLPLLHWRVLTEQTATDLSRFGQPLAPQWTVSCAYVRPSSQGRPATVFYQDTQTPAGPYPFPQEMRFGARSITKSIAAPLALLRLAELNGPTVLDLTIGAYVPGLHPKFNQVRFIDAANMASGFGGTGTLQTQPNDYEDGYLDADYDSWYTAPSHAEKLAHTARWLTPYPWKPGTVLRYRDEDFYLLGAALTGYLRSLRGPHADIWDFLSLEVFEAIGIHAAPTTRTQEPTGQRGLPWFNAGYFPTLDDLAKIALLYQCHGEWKGRQILHRHLTADLLSARGALSKRDGTTLKGYGADSMPPGEAPPTTPTHYRMGFHFTPHQSRRSGRLHYLPTMWAAGESEVILYPNGAVSIRIGKAASVPGTAYPGNVISEATIETVEQMAPWD
jgi:CubicO group peptidase (beta-lactamase class C family)